MAEVVEQAPGVEHYVVRGAWRARPGREALTPWYGGPARRDRCLPWWKGGSGQRRMGSRKVKEGDSSVRYRVSYIGVIEADGEDEYW